MEARPKSKMFSLLYFLPFIASLAVIRTYFGPIDGVIGHERTKVLLLVHPDTAAARESVQTLIQRYRKIFEQESVLWETARVCAAQ